MHTRKSRKVKKHDSSLPFKFVIPIIINIDFPNISSMNMLSWIALILFPVHWMFNSCKYCKKSYCLLLRVRAHLLLTARKKWALTKKAYKFRLKTGILFWTLVEPMQLHGAQLEVSFHFYFFLLRLEPVHNLSPLLTMSDSEWPVELKCLATGKLGVFFEYLEGVCQSVNPDCNRFPWCKNLSTRDLVLTFQSVDDERLSWK